MLTTGRNLVKFGVFRLEFAQGRNTAFSRLCILRFSQANLQQKKEKVLE